MVVSWMLCLCGSGHNDDCGSGSVATVVMVMLVILHVAMITLLYTMGTVSIHQLLDLSCAELFQQERQLILLEM